LRQDTNAPRLSVSTFSLHRTLSVTYRDTPGGEERTRQEPFGPGQITLLEVPARIAAEGFRTLEISHPHLPSRDTSYLNELRAALNEAGVYLLSLLVEDGDITHPDHSARDLDWIGGWIETAGRLGAERARVIAGKSEPSPEAIQCSRCGLGQLAERGLEHGVRVTVENWFALLSRPHIVIELLESLEGKIGFNLDFGNWSGPTKYADLAAIFPYAESCHAKCAFTAPGTPDATDYLRCLELAREARFSGPFTLIYDGPGDDEWEGLRLEREMVLPYIEG
jgi:sugar phosphate isomerase/epimerase